jgi:nicotinate phosphoribosyltransferase
MAELSFGARAILDQAGLTDATIFASGSLDEHVIAGMLDRGAPIDAFGVGSRLGVSADAPYLDMAYKLVDYGGQPVLKLSADKATWPGPKQVWRRRRIDGAPEDHIGLADETPPAGAEPLLQTVMRDGRRTDSEPLTTARQRARAQLAALPTTCRDLVAPTSVQVHFSQRLLELRDRRAAEVARSQIRQGA